jgi:Sad1 / UNC-like C-terminal
MLNAIEMLRRLATILLFVWSIYFLCLVQNTVANDGTASSSSSTNSQLDHMIQDVLKSSEQTLQEYKQFAAMPIPKTTSLSSRTDRIVSIQLLIDQLVESEQKRDTLISDINTKQTNEILQIIKSMVMSNHIPSTNRSQGNDISPVTMEQMERMFSPEVVIAESESMLSDWIKGIVNEEIKSLELKLDQINTSIKAMKSGHSSSDTDTCIEVQNAAKEVFDALIRFTHDGIGQIDYTKSIVHQYTSPTYIPEENDPPKLGTVWWNKYIPQDWENLLPVGWQSWIVPFIPDHIYHSLGISWGSQISSSIQTAPPETILQSSTMPGNCWPISMHINGIAPMVTIRLQQPITVSAITIDHTSKLLLQHPKQQLKSAPKHMKVYGYGPCKIDMNEHTGNDNCHGLEFDISSKTLLTEITYNIHHDDNIQTFPIESSRLAVDHTPDESCSTRTGSCNGTREMVVAAITVEIVDNWGNEEFACLYRVRVHGAHKT